MSARVLIALLALSAPASALAQQVGPRSGVDAFISQSLGPAAEAVGAVVLFAVPVYGADLPLIVIWLIAGALFFTCYFRFINLRGLPHAIALVRGKHDRPGAPGEITHFQALSTALASTVGLGNIAGVAIAISMGGPGAMLWMILAGFLGMSLKFAECTLGVKYRHRNDDGSYSGGPMHYLRRGLEERGLPRLGKLLAGLFAALLVVASLGGGNVFQVNQAHQQWVEVVGQNGQFAQQGWLFGLGAAVLVGMVIMGGIKSIARVTDKLVPFMAAGYLLTAIGILLWRYAEVPAAMATIVTGAVAPESVAGGILGALIAGFRRSAFSNEAGLGTAPIAHAVVKTDEPVTEGFVASIGPLVDTVIVCTTTALIITISGVYGNADSDVSGVKLTSQVFGQIADWLPYALALAVTAFALSTMIAFSYYGLKAWSYWFGETRHARWVYQGIFCVFVLAGPTVDLQPVVAFMDAMNFSLALPNILGLYLLAPLIKREYMQYWRRMQR